MSAKFIAFILSAATAITFTAAPARADGEDLARALAAIAGIAIIGKVIHDSRKDDDDQVTYYQPSYPQNHQPPAWHTPGRNNNWGRGYDRGNYGYVPRPVPPQVSRLDLPRSCLNTYRSGGHNLTLLGTDCLQDRYAHTNVLPRACRYKYVNRFGVRTGYVPSCLRERGYRIKSR